MACVYLKAKETFRDSFTILVELNFIYFILIVLLERERVGNYRFERLCINIAFLGYTTEKILLSVCLPNNSII